MKNKFSRNDCITDPDGKVMFRFLESPEYNDHYFIVRAENVSCRRISLLKYVDASDDAYKINNLTREGNFQFHYPYIEHVYGNFNGMDPDNSPVFGTEVEFVEGTSLTDYRKQMESRILNGEISRKDGEQVLFRQMMQFLCGMNYYTSYAKQIYLQRDLKPDNIRITPEGDVKIIDFDVAHISGSNKTLHVTGWEAGFSRGYTSPEVYSLLSVNRGQDLHCEIYSAGRVLFYWLNGEEYYPKDQLEPGHLFSAPYCVDKKLAYGVNSNRNRFLKVYLKKEYEPLIQILHKMCASPEEKRYESVSEIISDMKKFLFEYCGRSKEALADYLKLSEWDLLLESGEVHRRSYIPLVYRIDGKRKGRPLYENSMMDISREGRCLVTVYNTGGEIGFIPGAGLTIEGASEHFSLQSGDTLVCGGNEIEFTIGREISC